MLPPTSQAAGLKPHINWSFDSEDEAKQSVTLLSDAQETAKGKYAQIRFDVEFDAKRKCYNVIIWNQASPSELEDNNSVGR